MEESDLRLSNSVFPVSGSIRPVGASDTKIAGEGKIKILCGIHASAHLCSVVSEH